MKLEGKVAIVTGAASGIGRGITLCFAEEGADVVIADMAMDNANKVAEEVRGFGRKALVVEADVSQKEDVERLVESALNTFGKIDILVNNAAGGRPRSGATDSGPKVGDISEETWDATYEGVFKSQVLMCRSVVPLMKAQQSGKVINISSVAGKVGDASRMAYSSLKGAVISFTRTLAREVATENINVNCICPGLIYTPAWQKGAEMLWKAVPIYREFKEARDVFQRYVDKLTPMKREQTAEDIGRLAVFLSSEDARNITGQTINVDGGQVMD